MYSPKRRFRLFRSQVDTLRLQLTTSLTAYDAAAANDWITITSTEYNAIFTNIVGATKKGNTDDQINTRAVAAGYVEAQFGSPGDETIPITIDTGEYALAFVSETWNGTTTVQFGTTTVYHTGAPTYGNSLTINPVQRNYYLRKAPITPAAQTLYPSLKIAGNSFNLVPSTTGWVTSNGGVSWSSAGTTAPKFQMITTTTKSW